MKIKEFISDIRITRPFNVSTCLQLYYFNAKYARIGLSILSATTVRKLLVLPLTLTDEDATLLRTIA